MPTPRATLPQDISQQEHNLENGSTSRGPSSGEAVRTDDVMDVRQVGGVGKEAAGRVAPVVAQVSHGVSHSRAGASSSGKHTAGGTSGDCYEKLNQASAPRSGSQYRALSGRPSRSTRTTRYVSFEVHIFCATAFFSLIMFSHVLHLLLSVQSVATVGGGQGESRVHRRPGVAAVGREI
jgi:hypothetical protein